MAEAILSPSRRRLKKRASERSSGIWRLKPSAGMPSGNRNHSSADMTMTEDAKTEENTAGSPLRCVHRSAQQGCGLQGVEHFPAKN